MVVADTSLMAFAELQSCVGERRQLILNMIKSVPKMTTYEYSKILGKNDPNYVRPRVTELRRMNKVTSVGKRQCSVTGKRVNVWVVKNV